MVATALEPLYAEAAKENKGGRPRKDDEKPVENLPPVSAQM